MKKFVQIFMFLLMPLIAACDSDVKIGGINGGGYRSPTGGPSDMPWAKPAAWEYENPTIESTHGMGGRGARRKSKVKRESRFSDAILWLK
jgi:hypothetical protein